LVAGDGKSLGTSVGSTDGTADGFDEGTADGRELGYELGPELGYELGEGERVGPAEGGAVAGVGTRDDRCTGSIDRPGGTSSTEATVTQSAPSPPAPRACTR